MSLSWVDRNKKNKTEKKESHFRSRAEQGRHQAGRILGQTRPGRPPRRRPWPNSSPTSPPHLCLAARLPRPSPPPQERQPRRYPLPAVAERAAGRSRRRPPSTSARGRSPSWRATRLVHWLAACWLLPGQSIDLVSFFFSCCPESWVVLGRF